MEKPKDISGSIGKSRQVFDNYEDSDWIYIDEQVDYLRMLEAVHLFFEVTEGNNIEEEKVLEFLLYLKEIGHEELSLLIEMKTSLINYDLGMDTEELNLVSMTYHKIAEILQTASKIKHIQIMEVLGEFEAEHENVFLVIKGIGNV